MTAVRVLSGLAAVLGLAWLGQRWAEARDRRAFPAPGTFVTVDGVVLHVVVTGSGPTVLLDSGLGGCSDEWHLVAAELERTCTVVRYDRPGFGWSPAADGRGPEAVARRIRGLLDALGLPGPAVLVGHSMGGLHVRLTASLYPDAVAALVLVDPSHEDMLDGDVPAAARVVERVLKAFAAASPFGVARVGGRLYGKVVAGQARREPDEETRAMSRRQTLLTLCSVRGMRAVATEMVAVAEDLQEVRELTATHPVPPLPLIVISAAAEPRTDAERQAQQTMRELHAKHAALSPQGRQVLAERSGHLVVLDEPELVAECVRGVLAEVTS